MKKWILLLTLCISLLLSGCQKTPEAQPGTQPAEAPWADEQADALLSYEDYFAELRPYDPAENDVPDWMKDGNYEILSEDGVLSLYQAEDGTLTRLFAYPVEAPLGWSAGPACLYAFDHLPARLWRGSGRADLPRDGWGDFADGGCRGRALLCRTGASQHPPLPIVRARREAGRLL